MRLYSIYMLYFGYDSYIGATAQDVRNRTAQHRYDTNNPNSPKYNHTLFTAMREIGFHNMICKVLFKTMNMERAIELEEYFIKAYKPSLNVRSDYGFLPSHTPETRALCRNNLSIHSEEHVLKRMKSKSKKENMELKKALDMAALIYGKPKDRGVSDLNNLLKSDTPFNTDDEDPFDMNGTLGDENGASTF